MGFLMTTDNALINFGFILPFPFLFIFSNCNNFHLHENLIRKNKLQKNLLPADFLYKHRPQKL